ncbi:hypothetical protein RCG24_04530 [Neobacillus sp. OS1-32]|jgi:hypothetical protein|uniref:Phage ABA sandwich domain-containing protein n=1 Tax=Neobacillus paridis TaxID=2803862 RepID=A0ABS1TK24_9BACI|nr:MULTISPECIES: hypothetical protein [Neobacillus]MBL4950863.1 hypothetical protein [Neobacillus paridis]WML31154.1 hypothetical protein RCG24_04530 [Neobacillus sp. OS1-32]
MVKTDSIARRIMGWKLNRWDRWYDYEKGIFIQDTEFQPEQNLNHALQIVDRLEQLGYTYTVKGTSRVCFNEICATGENLAQAITNAAYTIIEHHSIPDTTRMWQKLC